MDCTIYCLADFSVYRQMLKKFNEIHQAINPGILLFVSVIQTYIYLHLYSNIFSGPCFLVNHRL